MTTEIAVTTVTRPVVINFPGGPGGGGIPTQNVKNVDYTFTLSDGTSKGNHVKHSAATANVYTIPKQATLNFPIGEGIWVVNGASAGVITVQIDTSGGDVMVTDGTGATTSVSVGASTSIFLLKDGTQSWRAYPGA